MGIQDRDYYREGPSFLDRVGDQGATVWLIAITVGVFFGQMLSLQGLPRVSPLVTYGAYDPKLILEGEVWRLLTAVFLHGGLWHLFFNMFTLHWAGGRLEEERGSRELILFYLIGGVAANVLFLLAQVAGLTPMNRAIGASGAVTAALVVFACTHPHAQLRVWFVLPMPAWLVAVVFVGMDCAFGFSMVRDPRGVPIAYFGHIGGAVFGLLYYQSGVQFGKLFERRSRPRARPKLRVVPPPVSEPEPVGAAVSAPPKASNPTDEQLEAKLDAVLEKVSKHGPESLTPEEREILVKASELYKKRRK